MPLPGAGSERVRWPGALRYSDGAAMKLLAWLLETFITTFGITRPRPEQERTAQLLIGGFLLACILVVAGVTIFLLVEIRAPH